MAALSSFTQNTTRRATNNVVKAVLCIRKVQSLKTIEALGNRTGTLTAIDDIRKLEEKLMERAEKSLSGGAVSTYNDIKSFAGMNGFIALGLQYNPSSLRLDTSAGVQRTYSGDPGNEQVSKFTAPAATTLSCELLFDDVNQMDAFMLNDSPYTGGLGLSFSNATRLVNYGLAFGKKGFSVQKQMEGLLSMLAIPQARHVIFFWGNMCFRGEMTEVSSEYTMFNKKGAPIRGRMSIQIRQGDGSDAAQGSDADYYVNESYWTKAFNSAFKQESGLPGKVGKFTNNSLLNLRL
ncbi:MAG: hypothetical protein IJT16_09515 [Lachnospiraceae bacterium]|nr:hypothetical protein [Lachnospiraceae bacterium]